MLSRRYLSACRRGFLVSLDAAIRGLFCAARTIGAHSIGRHGICTECEDPAKLAGSATHTHLADRGSSIDRIDSEHRQSEVAIYLAGAALRGRCALARAGAASENLGPSARSRVRPRSAVG